jgi:cytochrome P450
MSVSEMITAAPRSDYDPYTDDALLDPWLGYKRLRDAGPAVWLTKYQMFALTRYDSVRRALLDWESLSVLGTPVKMGSIGFWPVVCPRSGTVLVRGGPDVGVKVECPQRSEDERP